MLPTSRIEVDLATLDHNLNQWRKLVDRGGQGCTVCPVIKADAYGLGAVQVARRLAAAGVKLVAVYCMQQAADLAAAGIPISVLVLAPADEVSRTDVVYRAIVAGRLHLTVHSLDQLDHIESIGTMFGSTLPVHVEVDTGMCRVGMPSEEVDGVLAEIERRRYVKLAGIFTHTASADDDAEFTDLQLERFDEVLRRNARHITPQVSVHFGSTAAGLRDRRYHHTMIRVGLGLFGYAPGMNEIRHEAAVDQPPDLRPIVRWTSRIVHVTDAPAGVPVGYNGLFRTTRPSRLGVIPVGYADGYPLSLTNKGIVRVGPDLIPCPVRGQVNMDQIIIDLTDHPDPTAGVNTEVELIARDPKAPNALPRLAELADSSCYEMLCRLSNRVQRRYVITDRATGLVGHVATV